MRPLAAAVLAGLALIAGAMVYSTHEEREGDPYADAEQIVSAVYDAAGAPVQSVERLTGPYVVVKHKAGQCSLVDVSTQYDGNQTVDYFWTVSPFGGRPPRSLNC